MSVKPQPHRNLKLEMKKEMLFLELKFGSLGMKVKIILL